MHFLAFRPYIAHAVLAFRNYTLLHCFLALIGILEDGSCVLGSQSFAHIVLCVMSECEG